MLSNGLEPHTIHISNQLIRSVATARQKYQTFLENSREERRSKKINDQKSFYDNENYNFYNYLHVLIFSCKTHPILFTTQEGITCSKPGKKTLKHCQKS